MLLISLLLSYAGPTACFILLWFLFVSTLADAPKGSARNVIGETLLEGVGIVFGIVFWAALVLGLAWFLL